MRRFDDDPTRRRERRWLKSRDRFRRGVARTRDEGRLRGLRSSEAPCVGHIVGRDRNPVARAWPKRSARHDHDSASIAQTPTAVLLLRGIRIAIARRVECTVLDRLAVFGQRMIGEFGLHQPSDLQCDRKPDRALVTTTARKCVRRLEPDPFQRYIRALAEEIRPRVDMALRPPAAAANAALQPSIRRSKLRRNQRPRDKDRASGADETVPRANDRSAASPRTCCIPTRAEDSPPRRRLRPSSRLCRASLCMHQAGIGFTAAYIVGEIRQQVMRMRGGRRAQPGVVADRAKPVAAAIEVDALQPGHRRCAFAGRRDRSRDTRRWRCHMCHGHCDNAGSGRGQRRNRRAPRVCRGDCDSAGSGRGRHARSSCASAEPSPEPVHARLPQSAGQPLSASMRDSVRPSRRSSRRSQRRPVPTSRNGRSIRTRSESRSKVPRRRLRRQRRRFCASGSMNRYGGAPPKRNTSPWLSLCVRRMRPPLMNVPAADLRSTR